MTSAGSPAAFPLARYRDGAGELLVGWTPAPRARRAAAWAIDLGLIVLTVGVGWLLLALKTWPLGTTPGKRLLGLTVFATDTRAPADRRRMLLRALVHRSWARLFGLATFGLGYLYVLGGAAGRTRRTLYDDWAQTIVLARPSA